MSEDLSRDEAARTYAKKETVLQKVWRALVKAAMWLKGRRANKKLMLQVLAVATVAATTVTAFVVERLDDRVSAVEDRPVSAPTDLSGVEARLTALAKKVSSIQESVRRLNQRSAADVDALTRELSAAASQINGLAEDITALSTKVAAAEESAEIAALAEKIDAVASTAADAAQQAAEAAQKAADAALTAAQAANDPVARRAAADALQAAQNAAAAADEAAAAAEAASVTAEEAAAAVEETNQSLPYTISVAQANVGDGQTVVKPAGTLVAPADGEYTIAWSFQDGYGCNGDAIKLLVDGTAKASWGSAYGNCNQQFRTQTFTTTKGPHVLGVSLGCLPPGNGACVMNVTAMINRVR